MAQTTYCEPNSCSEKHTSDKLNASETISGHSELMLQFSCTEKKYPQFYDVSEVVEIWWDTSFQGISIKSTGCSDQEDQKNDI